MPVVDLRVMKRSLTAGRVPVESAVLTVTAVRKAGPFVQIDGEDVVFSFAMTAAFADGAVTDEITLPATDGTFGYEWEIVAESQLLFHRLTNAPDVARVDFGDLDDLDRDTLDPTESVVAAWETVAGEVFAARDETATAAGGAADSATAAEGFAGAAAGSASTATTAAGTATSAAGEASSAASTATGAANSAGAARQAAAAARDDAVQARGDVLAVQQSVDEAHVEVVAARQDIQSRTMTATPDASDPGVLVLTFPSYMLHTDGTSVLLPLEASA